MAAVQGRHHCRTRLPAVAMLAWLVAACASIGGLLGGAARSDPEALIGLAPEQIGETLGDPELQRLEPPAEVWQYRTETCVFDLYLYEEDGIQRAAHYQARSRDNGIVDPAVCLGSVVRSQRVAESGVASGPAIVADPQRF